MTFKKFLLSLACAGPLVVAGPAFAQAAGKIGAEIPVVGAETKMDKEPISVNITDEGSMRSPTDVEARAVLAGWKATPRKAGEAMIVKYGPPREMTATRMVWLNNGPWKWSILTNEPTAHDFPVAHEDVLEQAIAYDIIIDKVDELAAYDGSVVANRTQGELSARCDTEGANYLALNLAHDVSTGSKSVEAARAYYANAIDVFTTDQKKDVYMTGLKFKASASATTSDPDTRASL